MSLSPDGTRAAVVKTDGDGSDLWVLDLERGTQQRLTQGMRISNVPPLWSADGKHLVYAPVESGITIYRRAADASGGQEAIFKGPEAGYVSSLSKDGRYLLRMMVDILGPEGTGLVTLEPGKMGAGAALKFRGNQAHFSPDGKWIAYVETGGVFVTPFRGEAEGAKYPVSTAGGRNPQWSRDGKELYFQSAAGLMVAAMTGDPARPVGTPRLLHKLPTGTGGYDRTPDGRTLALVPLAQTEPPSITVVLNWQTALPRGLASPRP
jgi:dipeptidyl aminopeptidase/acylaminoacyl peptidase